MASLSDTVYDFFFGNDFYSKVLVNNGYICFSIIVAYVLFVEWIGPQLMANSKPFNLKYPMIFHNFLLSAVNLHLAFWAGHCLVRYWYSRCLFRDSEVFPKFLDQFGAYIWQLYLVKFMELLDTVFFVLRKKNNQITFLHVFHHSVVCGLFWWILNSKRVGFYLFTIVSINCSVHVVMYAYYGLSAFGPHMQKYLWWKKYLTTMQITQFCIIQFYMLQGFLTGCEYMDALEITLFTALTVILVLFCNFYRKTFKEQ